MPKPDDLDAYCQAANQRRKADGLFRVFRNCHSESARQVEVDGKPCINFASNDYYGLSRHPRIRTHDVNSASVGAGASRYVSGNSILYGKLEAQFAAYKRKPACLVFTSGYAANVGCLPALLGEQDVVFSDALNHASLIDGLRLAKARVVIYPHLDYGALRRAMGSAPCAGRRWIVTESVFSMDGDIADLRVLAELKREFGAAIYLDDAHATGILGPNGSGAATMQGVAAEMDVIMSTFSKAFGSLGGAVAASQEVIDYVRNHARSLIYTTGLPPAVLGATLGALELLNEHFDQFYERLAKNVKQVRSILSEFDGGYPDTALIPIIPLVVGDSARTMALSGFLLERGLFVPGIRPPTVPEGAARLRFTVSSQHTEHDMANLRAALNAARRDGLIG